jgi:hypothetical protein
MQLIKLADSISEQLLQLCLPLLCCLQRLFVCLSVCTGSRSSCRCGPLLDLLCSRAEGGVGGLQGLHLALQLSDLSRQLQMAAGMQGTSKSRRKAVAVQWIWQLRAHA